MHNNKPIANQSDAPKIQESNSDHQKKAVNLVDMGKVSETKGFLRGLELGYTPRG